MPAVSTQPVDVNRREGEAKAADGKSEGAAAAAGKGKGKGSGAAAAAVGDSDVGDEGKSGEGLSSLLGAYESDSGSDDG